ncbi:hypothetical protein [Peribacillus kribbensis]|uniref:hypothetical protein n=1 Tax=Peribacillus kribbensis TaxID=356658 RepID=UPI0004140B7E|nr:hypothetical protein [Peribacillus kribbensis]
MDYDTRISRLEAAIHALSSAPKIAASAHKTASSGDWEYSKAKNAYEDWINRMETFLSEAGQLAENCIQALERQLAMVRTLKMAEYREHLIRLSGLDAKERAAYISSTSMDPSVRAMLY